MDEESGSASIFRLDLRYRYRQYRIDLPILRPVALSMRVMQGRFSAPKAAPNLPLFRSPKRSRNHDGCGCSYRKFNRLGPAILPAVVGPLEPPLPAKVTADQVLKFAESLLRGEPNRTQIAPTALSDKIRETV
jgi:hypothetical protein